MLWQQVTGNTGYISIGNAFVPGYVLSSGGLVLIDSGPVESPRLLELLAEYHWQVRAVIHTHLHIDHVANNRLLSENQHAMFYATEEEVKAILTPERMLRAFGLKTMEQAIEMKKFYQQTVISIDPEKLTVCIEDAEFKMIPLYGHSIGHAAVVTPDDVCCLGDAIVSGELLKKSKLPYMFDVGNTLASMKKIQTLNYPYYVAAHQSVETAESLKKVVAHNISKEQQIHRVALDVIEKPVPMTEAVDHFIRSLGIRHRQGWGMDVIRGTAKNRLVYLEEIGKLKTDENGIVYRP